jgi:hypothetical protein
MENAGTHKKVSVWPFVLIPLGLVAVYYFLPFILYGYPPNWLERRGQRQEVLQRIQSAGGWAALKQDCEELADRYKDDRYGFRWLRGDTNSLPPAIAALRPKGVEFYPPSVFKQFGSESVRFFGSNAVVRISIFGAHATGGHDQPWLGLDVLCEHGLASYHPDRLRSTTPLKYWRYRKIAEDIYEYY